MVMLFNDVNMYDEGALPTAKNQEGLFWYTYVMLCCNKPLATKKTIQFWANKKHQCRHIDIILQSFLT